MSDKNFKVKNGLDANGAVTITQPDTYTTPLIIKANTLATGSNMLEMQRPDGTVRFAIGNDGALTVNSNINFNGGNMTMYPANSGQTALIVMGQTNQSVANLIVRAGTGQSGNLQEWRDQNNNVAVSVGPDFALRGIAGGFFGTANGNIVGVNYLGVKGWAASHIPFVVQGVASQTGDLTRWVDSSANTLAKVDASGSITAVDLTLSGNLTVNGTTTNINSTNLVIEDKNIVLADVATPTDTTADGAGITIKGATDKTLSWVQSTKSFTTSEPVIINNSSTDVPTLIVKLNTGQTSNIQEWRDHVGNVVAKIGPLYGSNIFQFDPFSYGAGSGYSSIGIGGRFISNEQRAAQSKFGVTTGEWVLGALRATDNQVGAFAASTTLPTFVIKGIASQTANYLEIKDSSDVMYFSVTKPSGDAIGGGGVQIRPAGTGGRQTLHSGQAYAGFAITTTAGQPIYMGTIGGGSSFEVVTNDSYNRYKVQGTGTGTAPIFTTDGLDTDVNMNIYPKGAGKIGINTTSPTGYVHIKTPSATVTPLIVQATDSQTANIFEVQNSSATSLFVINGGSFSGSGSVSVGNTALAGTTFGSQLYVQNNNTARVGVIIKGTASQTADLQQWQDSAGTVLSKIKSDGYLYVQNSDNSMNVGIGSNNIYFGRAAGTYLTNTSVGGVLSHSATASSVGDTIVWTSSTNGLRINSSSQLSASVVPLVVRGSASQTANLQEWHDNNGNVLSYIGNSTTYLGSVLTVGNDIKATYGIHGGGLTTAVSAMGTKSWSASIVAMVVRGAASQTASLQEWQDSAGTVLSKVDSAGNLNFLNKTVYANQVYVGTGSYLGATMHNQSGGAGEMRLLLRAHASQTANIQEWQTSGGAVIANISSNGGVNSIGASSFGYSSYTDPLSGIAAAVKIGGGTGATQLGIQTSSATGIGIIVRASASQTADLLQIQDSGGTTRAAFERGGALSIQPSTAVNGYTAFFKSPTASVAGIMIRGAASQTANLTEWQNSSGTVLASISPSGAFSAVTKSFVIKHPTKEGKLLRYGSLEGPENGVYIRGKIDSSNVIELPDYWIALIDESTITVNLTPIGSSQNLYVEDIKDNKIYVSGGIGSKFFYTIFAERKDVTKLVVEE